MAEFFMTDNLVQFSRKAEWQNSQILVIYDGTVHVGAKVVGRIDNGVDAEVLNITLTHFGASVGLDVHRVGVDNKYLDLTISADISGNDVRITIQNNQALENNTFEYYIAPITNG